MARSVNSLLVGPHPYSELIPAARSIANDYGGWDDTESSGPGASSLSLHFSGSAASGFQRIVQLDPDVYLYACDQVILKDIEFQYFGTPVFGVGFRISGQIEDRYNWDECVISEAGTVSITVHHQPFAWSRRIASGQRLRALFILGPYQSMLAMLGFQPEEASEYLSRLIPTSASLGTQSFPLNLALTNLLADLIAHPVDNKLQRLRLRAKCLELLYDTFLSAEECARSASHQPKYLPNLLRAAEILQQELDGNHTLANLSRRVGLSRTNLACSFKDMFGQTVQDYLRCARMKKAEQLLGDRQLQIAEIAEIVGYESAYSFSRAFKEWSGHPPRGPKNQC